MRSIPSLFAVAFVGLNLALQLSGSIFVLTRKHVNTGIALLFAVILLQTIAYSSLWSTVFIMRSLSLIGGLALLFAERLHSPRMTFAGVPTFENATAKSKRFFVLLGRILSSFMFLSLIHGPYTLLKLLGIAACALPMAGVALGYKTKASAVALAALLTVTNFTANRFWMERKETYMRDHLKYDFFQTFSVIGALLLLIALGPGEYSVDVGKKDF